MTSIPGEKIFPMLSLEIPGKAMVRSHTPEK